jgi:hypothetical protein
MAEATHGVPCALGDVDRLAGAHGEFVPFSSALHRLKLLVTIVT